MWHLGPLWFMSNAQIATLAIGLIRTAGTGIDGQTPVNLDDLDLVCIHRPLIGVGARCMLLVSGEAPAQVGSLAARTSTGLMSGGAASSSSARCSSAAAIGPSR